MITALCYLWLAVGDPLLEAAIVKDTAISHPIPPGIVEQ